MQIKAVWAYPRNLPAGWGVGVRKADFSCSAEMKADGISGISISLYTGRLRGEESVGIGEESRGRMEGQGIGDCG